MKFRISSSKAVTDCLLETVTFLTMSQSRERWPITSIMFNWILSKTVSLLISSFLSDPCLSFRIDMAKSSNFLTCSTLSGTGFSFNMLECSSFSERYSSKCYKRSFWSCYLIFVSSVLRYHLESFDCRFIAKWITVWCYPGSWWVRRRMPSFSLSSCIFRNIFSYWWGKSCLL